MADLTRAEELVQTMERDPAFRAEVESAPTVTAKRQMLDARGFADIDFDDMKVYVESKGGTLIAKDSGRELSEQELASVAGGLTETESIVIYASTGFVIGAAATAAVA